MKIPSPRAFCEIVAFIMFAAFVTIGMIAAVALLLFILAAEKIVDGVRQMRRRAQ